MPAPRLTIGVCTSANESNITSVLSKLRALLATVNVVFVSLPYNDIDSYPVEKRKLDGLILCHSINNRRFAVTNVLDALYDKFLPRAEGAFGKKNIAVIVHDFKWPFASKSDEMFRFRQKQHTTFQCCHLAILCGKLDTAVEMDRDDWQQLTSFAQSIEPRKYSTGTQVIYDKGCEVVQTAVGTSRSVCSLLAIVILCSALALFVLVASFSLLPLMLVILPVLLVAWLMKKRQQKGKVPLFSKKSPRF